MENKITASEILSRWPSLKAVAADVGKKFIVVYRWKTRNRIPAKYDMSLIEGASARNIPLNWRELMQSRTEAEASQ